MFLDHRFLCEVFAASIIRACATWDYKLREISSQIVFKAQVETLLGNRGLAHHGVFVVGRLDPFTHPMDPFERESVLAIG